MSDLARTLWDARRLGYTVEATACSLPKTKGEAYAVQDAIVELSGLPRAGYKVGSTSQEALNVLLWLANHQSARGVGLKAGEVVSTGTCTGLDAVHPGDVARADFGTLGTVAVSFA